MVKHVGDRTGILLGKGVVLVQISVDRQLQQVIGHWLRRVHQIEDFDLIAACFECLFRGSEQFTFWIIDNQARLAFGTAVEIDRREDERFTFPGSCRPNDEIVDGTIIDVKPITITTDRDTTRSAIGLLTVRNIAKRALPFCAALRSRKLSQYFNKRKPPRRKQTPKITKAREGDQASVVHQLDSYWSGEPVVNFPSWNRFWSVCCRSWNATLSTKNNPVGKTIKKARHRHSQAEVTRERSKKFNIISITTLSLKKWRHLSLLRFERRIELLEFSLVFLLW